jgi:hypothetical protein
MVHSPLSLLALELWRLCRREPNPLETVGLVSPGRYDRSEVITLGCVTRTTVAPSIVQVASLPIPSLSRHSFTLLMGRFAAVLVV